MPPHQAFSPDNSDTVGRRGRARVPYKVVVLGSCRVGKRALTIRFLHNHFVEEYDPTVRDTYQGKLEVGGEPCQLSIHDTSERELFQDLRKDCIHWGQGFLCVYTVDCFRSFMHLSLFRNQIRKIKGTAPVPMVLVANKVDEASWTMDSDMGQEAARSFGVPYVETLAKTGQGVEQAFQELVPESRRFQAGQDQGVPEAEQAQGRRFNPCTIQ